MYFTRFKVDGVCAKVDFLRDLNLLGADAKNETYLKTLQANDCILFHAYIVYQWTKNSIISISALQFCAHIFIKSTIFLHHMNGQFKTWCKRGKVMNWFGSGMLKVVLFSGAKWCYKVPRKMCHHLQCTLSLGH